LAIPSWVDIVKLGAHKGLAPFDDDWFFTRCASVLRHLYIRAPVGVGALTQVYGGRHRRGVRPSHFIGGSSSVARKSLQALEKGGWVDKGAEQKGRTLSKNGRRDCDRIANQLATKQTIRLV
jgi:small subunit ribosomal protein S19e